METLKIILEFVQNTAWPVVIFILFSYFSKPIKSLLTSFNEAINRGGVRLTKSGIEIPSLQNIPEPIRDFVKSPHYKNLLQLNKPEPLDDPLVTQSDNVVNLLEQHEKSLVNDLLATIQQFLSDTQTAEEKTELLQGLLCDAYICLYFERSFQRILGTQLTLLKKLENHKNGSLLEQEGAEIFKSSTLPQDSFEKWLSFLERSGFIVKHDKTLHLTKEGKEFLSYIKERGYLTEKPG